MAHWSLVQIMAQMSNMTWGSNKPDQLVRGCIDLKDQRGLKPQTMLNYQATFLLFVYYCYLLTEVSNDENDVGRLHAAIRDARTQPSSQGSAKFKGKRLMK